MYDIPNNEPSEDTPRTPSVTPATRARAYRLVHGQFWNLSTDLDADLRWVSGDLNSCSGDSNGTKTGTLMVEALQPTTMTITMVGTGLEGISLGLLF